jgi:hypothetical protein
MGILAIGQGTFIFSLSLVTFHRDRRYHCRRRRITIVVTNNNYLFILTFRHFDIKYLNHRHLNIFILGMSTS